jgi:HPt (histidine-containing phosphotransfer) domain-containing protein
LSLDKQKNRIKVSVDPDLQSLIPAFLEHRNQEIKLLRDALERSDYEAIKRLGHTIKGVGGGYGFDGLFAIAVRIEEAAECQNFQDIRKGTEDLASYFERVEIVYE